MDEWAAACICVLTCGFLAATPPMWLIISVLGTASALVYCSLHNSMNSAVMDLLREDPAHEKTTEVVRQAEPTDKHKGRTTEDNERLPEDPVTIVRRKLENHLGPEVPGPPSNLTGDWVQTSIEGDLDGFLEYVGFKRGTRLLLKAMAKASQITLVIDHIGDVVSMNVNRANVRGIFEVGKANPVTVETEFGMLNVTSRWQGGALRLEAVTPGARGFVRWMHREKNRLVVEQVTAGDRRVAMLYQLKSDLEQESSQGGFISGAIRRSLRSLRSFGGLVPSDPK